MTQLSPTQQQTFDHLLRRLPTYPVLEISGDTGSGKSILLHYAHQQLGGELLQMYDFIEQTRQYHPLALEEAFESMVMTALQQHSVVIIDDLQVLMHVCYGSHLRSGLLALPLKRLCAYANQAQKKLIVTTNQDSCYRLSGFYHHARSVPIAEFQAEDYEFLCHRYLDREIATGLDYEKIYRFASNLNAYQLYRTCLELNQDVNLTTERFMST